MSKRTGLLLSLRYAYDFVVVDDQGLKHHAEPGAGDEWYPGKSDTNEADHSLGVPIYAAGTGPVAAIHDGEPDNRSFNLTPSSRLILVAAPEEIGGLKTIRLVAGEVRIEGQVGQGTRLRVRVPLGASKDTPLERQ